MEHTLRDNEPGGAASAFLALLVHVLLFGFLIFGIRWQTRQPEAVVVELWDRVPAVEPPPRVEARPEPKPEPKPEPRVEPKPPPKPDIALEQEKKKVEPKKEEPRKEPPLKLDVTELMRQQLAREEQALRQPRESPPRAAPAPASVDAGYAARIRAAIRSNMVVPQNIQGNPEAEFSIVQLPTGEVLAVSLRKSSGNKVLDEAIERAILKSSPLPRPERPEQFQRELRITYRPLD